MSVHRAALSSPEDAALAAVLKAFLYALFGLGASGFFQRPEAPPATFAGMLALMAAPEAGRFFGFPWLGWSAAAAGVVVALVALALDQRRPEVAVDRLQVGDGAWANK